MADNVLRAELERLRAENERLRAAPLGDQLEGRRIRAFIAQHHAELNRQRSERRT
jgi:hypothetical protein